jgi:hypothetical protein
LLSFAADVRAGWGLLKVCRLASGIELFSEVLLLLLLRLPIHRVRCGQPGVVQGEVQAAKTKQQSQNSERQNQQVATSGGPLRPLQFQLLLP